MKTFRNFSIVALFFLLIGAGTSYYFIKKSSGNGQTVPDTELIQMQMKNVSKLVVNEAKVSQIYNYKNQSSFLNLISFDKKALVLVSADIQIMYDLTKLEYLVDESTKTVRIVSIPKEEIKISPDVQLYDIQESTFNSFSGSDYNEVKKQVTEKFREQVLRSNIQKNAKQRLVSELGKFLIVTKSLGWTLEYQDQQIDQLDQLEIIID